MKNQKGLNLTSIEIRKLAETLNESKFDKMKNYLGKTLDEAQFVKLVKIMGIEKFEEPLKNLKRALEEEVERWGKA